ncbi:hypothetical protein HRE53_05220 [Acaryochloris sp. 'Moss Beach']|uniref:hypothetical protein n=1 Tax=Acaryochloris TaxID=155977 RepID=UPI001BB067E1|nr:MULTISPECIES: hypothetical protein [Acaryochloris]QUY41330.1 hypothetical protein I1H34_18935 [Acaryochloris marina S15]UJB70501.1 hypothetical protein HRE53_05220 [Acaryochloris sp. 'Moss Beach']
MTANYWLFPALILAIVVILFLLRRVILTDRAEGQVLNEAKSKISSLTTQQEEWLANIQKTQEKLVMMFLALEETKKEAGLQSVSVSDKLRRASSAEKLLKNI